MSRICARAHVRNTGARRQGRRGHRAILLVASSFDKPPPIFWNVDRKKERERERERKNHPRNEAASIVGISRVLKQVSLGGARAWQLTLHLCLGSVKESRHGGFERDPGSKEKEYGNDGRGKGDEKRK